MIGCLMYMLVHLGTFTTAQTYYGDPEVFKPYYPAPLEKLVFIFEEEFRLCLGISEENIIGALPFCASFDRNQASTWSDKKDGIQEGCTSTNHPYKPDTWQPNNIASVWNNNGIFYFTMNNFSGNYTVTCDASRSFSGIRRLYVIRTGTNLPRRVFSCSRN